MSGTGDFIMDLSGTFTAGMERAQEVGLFHVMFVEIHYCF